MLVAENSRADGSDRAKRAFVTTSPSRSPDGPRVGHRDAWAATFARSHAVRAHTVLQRATRRAELTRGLLDVAVVLGERSFDLRAFRFALCTIQGHGASLATRAVDGKSVLS